MSNFMLFAAREQDAVKFHKEADHPFRTRFERDRDRILYCKEFRRLSGKTQVFVAGSDDNVRTRLTHTLEVTQIANTIARHLNLNDVLTEAISYGHDIGHTPFGHVGERTLNLIVNGCDIIKNINEFISPNLRGFKHNWQSIRVATRLEKIDRNFPGLNLTDYTLWGILNHSKLEYRPCQFLSEERCTLKHERNKACANKTLSLKFYDRYEKYLNPCSWTIEGFVVSWGDEIAQRNHDIQDGLMSSIIDKNELVASLNKIFKDHLTEIEKMQLNEIKKESVKTYYLSLLSKFIVNFYVTRLLDNTKKNLRALKDKYNLSSDNGFGSNKCIISKNEELDKIVSFEISFINQEKFFHKYIKDRIINSGAAQRMDGKSNYIILQLVKAYLTNPQQLPDSTIVSIYRNYEDYDLDSGLKKLPLSEIVANKRNDLHNDFFSHENENFKVALLRTICDYIAGMTDQYALDQYEILYGGTGFRNL